MLEEKVKLELEDEAVDVVEVEVAEEVEEEVVEEEVV